MLTVMLLRWLGQKIEREGTKHIRNFGDAYSDMSLHSFDGIDSASLSSFHSVDEKVDIPLTLRPRQFNVQPPVKKWEPPTQASSSTLDYLSIVADDASGDCWAEDGESVVSKEELDGRLGEDRDCASSEEVNVIKE
jgi:hypothetical protein